MDVLWAVALNGTLGAGAYLVARYGLRQPAGPPRWLAAVVVGWVWLTIGMELLGTLGLMARGPLLGWAGAGLAAGLVRLNWLPDTDAARRDSFGWDGVISLGLVLWVSAVLGFASLFLPVKVVSDGPIYHLYFAIRWWKAQALTLVPTPFGENAAPYFPANGDLWYAWLTLSWGSEWLAKVGQAPFVLVCGVASVAASRRLGASLGASVTAACWFLVCQPMALYSFEPNVDTIFVAAYLTSAYFFLRYAAADDGFASLALGATAAGLALGTKAPGVVFVPPLVLAGLGAVYLRSGRSRGTVSRSIAVLGLPLVTAGFWFARNAWLTGNPLYPLHLAGFGRVWLAGWYGSDVMTLSPYYLPRSDVRALGDILLGVFDPRLSPFWILALAGAWRWRRPRTPDTRFAWAFAGLAVANLALYWLAVPYRTQQRFMLQAIGLATIPLALLLDRSKITRAAGVVLLAVAVMTPHAWPFDAIHPPWDLTSQIPNDVNPLLSVPEYGKGPSRLRTIPDALFEPRCRPQVWSLLALGGSAFLLAWVVARGSRPSGRWWEIPAGLSAFLAVSVGLTYPWSASPQRLFFPPFPDYYRGWLELDGRSGAAGTRVAYSGTNLPYYLMGVGLRNEVRYVNIDAHPGWLLHDYHREASRDAPATWDFPRPGWDRTHPDFDAWRNNLSSEGIRLLVVAQTNPMEGPYNVADAEGFPIERVWADGHPDEFQLLYGEAEQDPRFRLYRFTPTGK